MKIVVDADIPYIRGVFESYFHDVSYIKGADINQAVVHNANALIVRTRTTCNQTLLQGSKVEIIATATIGTDHIDLAYCNEHSIKVFNAPGSNAGGVLQWFLAAISWLELLNQDKARKKIIGIVGVGNIGSRVARTLHGLGFEVLLCDPPRQEAEGLAHFVSMDEISSRCDVISFHVPLSFNGIYPTYHLANNAFFEKIKPGTLIINSSRGEVVNTKSIIWAIKKKGIIAAIDVWEDEPNISKELLDMVSLGTPHIAGYSIEGKLNASISAVRSISEHFGFGLNNWTPNPNPCTEKIHLQGEKYTTSDNYLDYKKLFADIFPIQLDFFALTKNPALFEQFRSNYQFRRENSAYAIDSKLEGKILSLLGSMEFTI